MSKNSRKLTTQIKKLKEVLEDALKEVELLEMEGATYTIQKGLNIVDDIIKHNNNGRGGE